MYLYINQNFASQYFQNNQLTEIERLNFSLCKLWIARWSDNEPDVSNTPWQSKGFSIWQYSNKGLVEGISGDVDLNRIP